MKFARLRNLTDNFRPGGGNVSVDKTRAGRKSLRFVDEQIESIRTVVTYPRSCRAEGKKFESLAGQHPGAARRGAARRFAGGQCTDVSCPDLFRYTYMQAHTADLRSSEERASGSIAGALSHTLSFSPSIGPERGHEKRLINRTNTGNILALGYIERKEQENQ